MACGETMRVGLVAAAGTLRLCLGRERGQSSGAPSKVAVVTESFSQKIKKIVVTERKVEVSRWLLGLLVRI